MEKSPTEDLVKLIRGISLFKTFTPHEAQAVLRIAKSKKCDTRQIVYEKGASSSEMFILWKGSLLVQSEKGVNIARIGLGESVGEIGVMTNAPRSARVVAAEESYGLSIQKGDLLNLLKSEKDLCIKFQRNLIDLLADRIRKTDELIDTYATKEKD